MLLTHSCMLFVKEFISILPMFFGYICRLDCHFNVIFYMVASNNKKKLPANDQNLGSAPLTCIG